MGDKGATHIRAFDLEAFYWWLHTKLLPYEVTSFIKKTNHHNILRLQDMQEGLRLTELSNDFPPVQTEFNFVSYRAQLKGGGLSENVQYLE